MRLTVNLLRDYSKILSIIIIGLFSGILALYKFAFELYIAILLIFIYVIKIKNAKFVVYFLLFFTLIQDYIFQITNNQYVKFIDESLITLIFLFNFTKIIKSKILYRYEIIPIYLFFITGIISSLLREVPFYIWSQGLFIYLKSFLLFLVSASLNWNERDFTKITNTAFFISIFYMFTAVLDFLFPIEFRNLIHGNSTLTFRGGFLEIKGMFTHPYFLAWYMSICIIFLLCVKKLQNNLWYKIFFICLITVLFLTLKRKELVAVLFLIFFDLVFINTKSRLKSLMYVIAIFIILSLNYNKFVTNIEDFLNRFVYLNTTNEPRVLLYYISYLLALKYFPIGSGFGTFGSWISAKYVSNIYYEYGVLDALMKDLQKNNYITDTYWAAIIGETGLLGLLFTLSFFIILIQKMLKKETYDEFDKLFLYLTIFYLIGSLGAPVFNQPPQNIWYFWYAGYWLKKSIFSKY